MSIRVATLNTWSLPGPLARHTRERMRAIGDALPDLDVDLIAFQEVWTQASRKTLISAAARAGYSHVWHKPETFGGGGLLAVSRVPFLEVHFEPFVARGFAERLLHMDYYSGKGFVLITIDTGEGPIVLLDTHLHANYARPGESDDYVGIRAAQTIQIAAALSQVAHPVIALGDFNLVENEDAYAMLLGLSGLSDVATLLDRRENTSLAGNPYHRAGHVDQRIDYVLIRNGPRRGLRAISIERIFDRDLEFRGERGAYSDHAGLTAELAFASSIEDPIPLDADALKIATQLLEEGRMISNRRKRRQRIAATGALAASLASFAGARKAEGSRRHFLKNSLRVVSGLSLAGFLEQAWLSEWMTRGEHAGYDFAEQQLSKFDIIIDTDIDIDRTGR